MSSSAVEEVVQMYRARRARREATRATIDFLARNLPPAPGHYLDEFQHRKQAKFTLKVWRLTLLNEGGDHQ